MSFRRIVLAFLLTPLVAPFYAAILFAKPWVLPIGVFAAYSSELVVGIPLFLFLRKRKWVRLSHLIIVGMFCGGVIVAAYSAGTPSMDVEPIDVTSALTIMAWSAFSGLCFWLVGISGDGPVTLRTLLNLDLSAERAPPLKNESPD